MYGIEDDEGGDRENEVKDNTEKAEELEEFGGVASRNLCATMGEKHAEKHDENKGDQQKPAIQSAVETHGTPLTLRRR